MVSMAAAAVEPTLRKSQILSALRALRRGSVDARLPTDLTGADAEIADTFNDVVALNRGLAQELARLQRAVGRDGRIRERGELNNASGFWKSYVDSVNGLIAGTVSHTAEISRVLRAVADGDLTQTMAVETDGGPLKGEFLRIARTVNTMVERLANVSSEVTRVAREVGTEGKLGGQAQVKGVGGTWKDLTDNVNGMADNLTGQVRNITDVTTAVARGDLSRKITADVRGELLELKDTINTMVDQLSSFAAEVTRVAREVGTEGKLGGEARVEGVAGTWKDLTDNVNLMATNLTGQVRNIADVTTAVARGDLSKKITVEVHGEILELKNTVNTMVDQLNSFASEVTRVAREVGTEGKLGGEARVEGVSGTWKDLTDNVNAMAANLTNQVRGIAEVVTAVANGELERKLTLDAKGEIAELADTINGMIENLATFADQVTNVAREVGIEGKLGGQAKVPGAAGLWRDLTDNVNELAANLTTQVRAIAEVATAVTKGDLTRAIAVKASGEVAALKDNINQMIANLRETTLYNNEQDWLKTNLARFTRMMQGERDLVTVCNLVLSELAPLVEAQQGLFYLADRNPQNGEDALNLAATYAHQQRKPLASRMLFREGLVGQCAHERQRILLTDVPGEYTQIASGLGQAAPLNLVVVPVLFEGEVLAVIELASFYRFSAIHLSFLDQLVESIGIVLNTISANMRTEGLLEQSQMLTRELQSQQEELTTTNDRLEQQAATLRTSEELLRVQQEELRGKNEELEEKAHLLEVEKRQVEAVNRQVQDAKAALEEKAEQLALTSKYKSEFLANMSHELRTPLNSLLILSKILGDNAIGNLDGKQVEQAKIIHASGTDLLRLINDILDLSKIESGTVVLEVGEMRFDQFRNQTERTFRQVAQEKGLDFAIEIASDLPEAMLTDAMRLQQIVNNLLSNAFKFTNEGEVRVSVYPARGGWSADLPSLAAAAQVVAFEIRDAGIGIAPEQQQVIFEAFQQADGTTSRRFGGTGLGLSISRELTALLGGEIQLESTPGKGSTFTLFVPLRLDPQTTPQRSREHNGRISFARSAGSNGATAGPAMHAVVGDDAESGPDPADGLRRRPLLLVVEDDPIFAGILLDLARDQGFDGMVVADGRAAPDIVREHRPDALVLDIQLPDIDGWTLLDLLRREPASRHAPVHVISAQDDLEERARRFRALGYSPKPASREELAAALARLRDLVGDHHRRLMVIGEEDALPEALKSLGDSEAVEVVHVDRRTAERLVEDEAFDCVLLADKRSSSGQVEFVRQLRSSPVNRHCSVMVLDDGAGAAAGELEALGCTVVAADGADGRLISEVTHALRMPFFMLPSTVREQIDRLSRSDHVVRDRTIAIIDDDIRNIFSLTAVLEQHGARVLHAESGPAGLDVLDCSPEVDAVLVDIMMPEMDGYGLIQEVRKDRRFRTLPLIAVTARAMKEDRVRCLEAGATDYISKPVDINELLSVLRTRLRPARAPVAALERQTMQGDTAR